MVRLIILLLFSISLSAQYPDCATAALNPISLFDPTMNSCDQSISNPMDITTSHVASSYPNGYCTGGGIPLHEYWVSFIMPPNSSTSFSMEFKLLGTCLPSDMTGLGVSVFKGTCGSFTNISRQCGFCSSTRCRRRTVNNAQLTPGTQVFLQIFDVNEFSCPVQLSFFVSPKNDNCSAAIPLNSYMQCNRGGTNNDPISAPGACFPKPPHKGGIFSIDNVVWFSFTVLPTDPQPYAITMKQVSCISGTKAMQMMVFTTGCDCSTSMNPCLIGCTAQSEPPTTDSLTIIPGAFLTPNWFTPPGNYLLAVDGGNGADCNWGFGFEPLPLSFVFTEAKEENESVQIRWLVADFKRAKQFEVQGSSDGISFYSIAVVPNISIDGFYSFIDENPSTYYRIKMVDFEGAVFYSEVFSSGRMIDRMDVIPSLISDQEFRIQMAGKEDDLLQVRVLDVHGKEVFSEEMELIALISNVFRTDAWSPGMYQVLVSCRRGVFVQKVMVLE